MSRTEGFRIVFAGGQGEQPGQEKGFGVGRTGGLMGGVWGGDGGYYRVGESSYRWQRALALCVSCRVSCAVRESVK